MVLHPVKRLFSISGFYTFFERCFAAGYSFEGEHHHFWEVVYCLNGTAGISADERIYYLRPGDIVIHRPYVHHTTWTEEISTDLMIFSFDLIGELPSELCGAFSCTEALKLRLNALYDQLKQCPTSTRCTGFLHQLDKNPDEYQRIANYCENCLLSLKKDGLQLGINQSKQAKDYERAIGVMRRNLSKNLSVEELARLCEMSASSLKNLFHRFNSMSVHEFYLHLKMQEAIRLLRMGRTVTETSEQLGFSNQSYFSTAFKRELKVSPGRYRELNI